MIDDVKEKALANRVPIIKDGGLECLLDLIRKNNCKEILELGTAVGYSSMQMAMLDKDIHVDTIEKNEDMYRQAIENIREANLDDQISVFLMPIEEFHTDKMYDLIFVDAAKAQYGKYLEQFLPNLKDDGYFFFDNMVFHGLIYDVDNIPNRSTRSLVRKIVRFRESVHNDKRFDIIEFDNVGDGVLILSRRSNMKLKNVVLLGFISSASDYLRKQLEKGNIDNISDFDISEVESIKNDLEETLKTSLDTAKTSIDSLINTGKEAFAEFIEETDKKAEDFLKEIDKILNVDFEEEKETVEPSEELESFLNSGYVPVETPEETEETVYRYNPEANGSFNYTVYDEVEPKDYSGIADKVEEEPIEEEKEDNLFKDGYIPVETPEEEENNTGYTFTPSNDSFSYTVYDEVEPKDYSGIADKKEEASLEKIEEEIDDLFKDGYIPVETPEEEGDNSGYTFTPSNDSFNYTVYDEVEPKDYSGIADKTEEEKTEEVEDNLFKDGYIPVETPEEIEEESLYRFSPALDDFTYTVYDEVEPKDYSGIADKIEEKPALEETKEDDLFKDGYIPVETPEFEEAISSYIFNPAFDQFNYTVYDEVEPKDYSGIADKTENEENGDYDEVIEELTSLLEENIPTSDTEEPVEEETEEEFHETFIDENDELLKMISEAAAANNEDVDVDEIYSEVFENEAEEAPALDDIFTEIETKEEPETNEETDPSDLYSTIINSRLFNNETAYPETPIYISNPGVMEDSDEFKEINSLNRLTDNKKDEYVAPDIINQPVFVEEEVNTEETIEIEEPEILPDSEDSESYVDELIEDLKIQLAKEEEEKRIEEEKRNSIYTYINKVYPYLSQGFIRSVYDLKDPLAREYKEEEKIILLHRVSFKDTDELRQFVEIVLNHDYGTNVDEKKMIVDVFKKHVNADGKILTNIFEIANQARLLNGDYEGYRVIREEEE